MTDKLIHFFWRTNICHMIINIIMYIMWELILYMLEIKCDYKSHFSLNKYYVSVLYHILNNCFFKNLRSKFAFFSVTNYKFNHLPFWT
jgi:hypothetical protein